MKTLLVGLTTRSASQFSDMLFFVNKTYACCFFIYQHNILLQQIEKECRLTFFMVRYHTCIRTDCTQVKRCLHICNINVKLSAFNPKKEKTYVEQASHNSMKYKLWIYFTKNMQVQALF